MLIFSAVITAEFANKKYRGVMMAAVFAMQGFGILTGAIVSIIFLSIFKNSIQNNINSLENVWRLIIAFGIVPCLVAIYFRLTIPETPRFTMQVNNNIDKGVNDVNYIKTGKKKNVANFISNILQNDTNKSIFSEFRRHFSQWKNLKLLIGTSVCWFALDVGFYGATFSTYSILESIGYGGSYEYSNTATNISINTHNYDVLFNNAVGYVIIDLMGLLPGYWLTVALIEKLGRKNIQIIGFVLLAVISLILGVAFDKLIANSVGAFIFLFTLLQFFQNFGPNPTTFIYPAELFPTRLRSTGHGIAAAIGKVGAIVSLAGFSQLGTSHTSISTLLIIYSGFMVIGLIFTFLLPETKGRSLEEINNEDE